MGCDRPKCGESGPCTSVAWDLVATVHNGTCENWEANFCSHNIFLALRPGIWEVMLYRNLSCQPELSPAIHATIQHAMPRYLCDSR